MNACPPSKKRRRTRGFPHYREENAGALRQDWPRVPLPEDAETLRAGAAPGRQIAALLDPETPVPGVTDRKVRPDLQGLGELTVRSGDIPVTGEAPAKIKNAARNVRTPYQTPDLAIAARRGYSGLAGAVIPGAGGLRALEVQAQETQQWIARIEGIAGTQGFDGSGC